MTTRAELLALRRLHLLAECDAQRVDLLLQARPFGHALTSLETGVRIVDRVRRHPGWIAAAALGLMAIRPRRLSALLRAGSSGLRGWRALAPLLQNLRG
jgi:hypothetical protein